MKNISIKRMLALCLTLALLAATLGVLPVPVAHAAGTINVNTTDDEFNADFGECSLREAIESANTNTNFGGCMRSGTAPYTISVPANTYTLTGALGEDNNSSGDLDIRASMTINGAGAGSTIIDGNNNDRVFHIDPTGIGGLTVNISGVTIQNGAATFHGGGIYNDSSTVNVTDSTLSGNQGRGIYNYGGTVTITDSTLSDNQADRGGGICNLVGTVTITDSTLSGNQGGGIYNLGGTVTITDSTLSGNQGRGIYNLLGTVNLTNSTLSGNQGSGIFNDESGRVTITNSTLSGNTVGGSGGGIYNQGGNHTYWGAVTITDSTISGNTAGENGGGIYNLGETHLSNVTIAKNTADSDNNGTGDGGGVYRGYGMVDLKNTIIAGNTDKGGEAPDCGGTLSSSGDNIVQNAVGCTLGGTGTNISVDPLLGSLADNGGATQTHALQAGSPAIDAVTDCTDLSSNPVRTDQRGVARPQSTACDIGAYEAAPELSIDKTVVPATNVSYRGVVTYTVVVSNSGVIDADNTLLTDTLSSQVDFARWVDQPTGADQANDQITWNGTVSASTALTFAFVVNHVGDYGDVVVNTAEYSHTICGGSDSATFTVIGVSYLPTIQKNNVITP